MKLRYDLNSDIIEAFNNIRSDKEEILYSLPIDINALGEFCDGWFIITSYNILVVYNDEITDKFPISSLTCFKAVNLVGNGYFEVEIDGLIQIIARYSMTHAPKYTYAEKALKQIKETGFSTIRSVDEDGFCKKCGKVMPEGTRLCLSCTNKWAVAKKIWEVAKKHKRIFLISILLFWVVSLFSLVQPTIQRIFVDDYLMPKKAEIGPFLVIVLALFLCSLFTIILSIIRGRLVATVGGRLSYDFRDMVYKKIHSLSLSYLDQRKTGDLMNRVTGDTNRIRNFIQNHANYTLNNFFILIGVTVLLFVRNWHMALLIIIPAPLGVIMSRAIWKKTRLIYREQYRVWDDTESLLQDILTGIRVVKAFGQEEHVIRKFEDSSYLYAKLSSRNEKIWNTLYPALHFVLRFGSYLVLVYGGSRIIGQTMEIGELIEFTQYANMIYGPLQSISSFPRSLADLINAAERIFEIVEEEPDVADIINPVSHQIEGNISFNNVTFGYKTHEPVLQDMTVNIEKGEMIGLVGHSGAGKSTFINLVMRLYDPDEGNITIDGIDIKDISQNELRSQIGVVLQETFLFSGTIFDNIRYSKPNATMDGVIRAAKIANAHDFIMRFPDAYDTKVGEKGHRLSGGERQRIAIARAILCDPKILILDEATASLDTETEQKIQEALGRLIKNRTTIAIAHRLSTLKNANKLLVIEEGRAIELGTHEELIDKKGAYYKMVMAQKEMTRMRGLDG